jgi:hypothetical protein
MAATIARLERLAADPIRYWPDGAVDADRDVLGIGAHCGSEVVSNDGHAR